MLHHPPQRLLHRICPKKATFAHLNTLLASRLTYYFNMDIYEQKIQWKIGLFVAAILIASASMLYTNTLAQQLANEERRNMEMWASALRQMSRTVMSDVNGDDSFWLDIIKNNTTIPVIVTDEKGNITSVRNFKDDRNWKKNITYYQQQLDRFKQKHTAIEIEVSTLDTTATANAAANNSVPIVLAKQMVYYDDSSLLVQIKAYPYVQLTITALFLLVAYSLFSSARRAEQNKVWLGMAKETAHQLGTPLSSMVGWVEMLKLMDDESGQAYTVAQEMEKDVQRLQLIADRFSKIGSEPKLIETDITHEVGNTLDYVKRRASSRVTFQYHNPEPVYGYVSPILFDWVIENLLKNALDAMDGKGEISVQVGLEKGQIAITVSDTGKGIPKSRFVTVFEPGFSTKKRGWGLGLSLSKRIIEEYHKGSIFVAQSAPDAGTTFKIVLPVQPLDK